MSAFNDIIEDVVDLVRAEYDSAADTPAEPYWFCGYERELFEILSEKDQSELYKYSKYPLIALLVGQETEESDATDVVSDFTILILTETDPHIRTKDRFLANYVNVLRPLKVLLKKYMRRSKELGSNDMWKWSVREWPYWGTDKRGANIGNDALDAIVISNMELELITTC